MTRKRILDITTTKKRDQMMSYTNARGLNSTTPDPANSGGNDTGSVNMVPAPALIRGNGGVYVFPWICTARNLSSSIDLPTSRNREVVYMRGLKERIRVETNTGASFRWRRIAFTYKGSLLWNSTNGGAMWDLNRPEIGASRNLALVSATARTVLDRTLFKGTFGKDYRNYMDAIVDHQTVNIKMDKTFNIRSGNGNGVCKTYNIWHPMNSNLVYDDDESGDGVVANLLSTNSKQGMGDYYIVDFIQGVAAGTSDDIMVFDPTATLYWHEK